MFLFSVMMFCEDHFGRISKRGTYDIDDIIFIQTKSTTCAQFEVCCIFFDLLEVCALCVVAKICAHRTTLVT